MFNVLNFELFTSGSSKGNTFISLHNINVDICHINISSKIFSLFNFIVINFSFISLLLPFSKKISIIDFESGKSEITGVTPLLFFPDDSAISCSSQVPISEILQDILIFNFLNLSFLIP